MTRDAHVQMMDEAPRRKEHSVRASKGLFERFAGRDELNNETYVSTLNAEGAWIPTPRSNASEETDARFDEKKLQWEAVIDME